jgi:hypothetical protein
MYEKYVQTTKEFSDLVLDGREPLDNLTRTLYAYIKNNPANDDEHLP